MKIVLILVLTQGLFTTGDLLARYHLRNTGFHLGIFAQAWFWVYFLIRQLAMIGQLSVFTQPGLGRTMALFGAVSIVLSNVGAMLLLGEILTLKAYVAISLAILAFLILAVIK